jgi:AcrR family transcriptional regulator
MATQIKIRDGQNNPDARTRVLDAAEAEFLEHGYAGASTNRILARFGGSKATVFRCFATKEAMFAAVVERIGEAMRRAEAYDDMADAPPPAWLHDFGRRTLAATLSREAVFVGRVVIAEGARFPAVCRRFVETTISPMLDLLADRLRGWGEAGELEVPDPGGDAVRLIDLIMSGPLSRTLFGVDAPASPAEVEAHVAGVVGLYLDGRRPR